MENLAVLGGLIIKGGPYVVLFILLVLLIRSRKRHLIFFPSAVFFLNVLAFIIVNFRNDLQYRIKEAK